MNYPLHMAYFAAKKGQTHLIIRWQAIIDGKIIKFPSWVRDDSVLIIDGLLNEISNYFNADIYDPRVFRVLLEGERFHQKLV